LSEENVYYNEGGVKVTSSYLSVGHTSYKISDVKSIGVRRVPSDKATSYMTMIIGILLFLYGLSIRRMVPGALGILFLLLGLRSMMTSVDKFELLVKTPSGMVKALRDVKSPTMVSTVERAVKDAVFEVQGKKI